MDNAPAGQWTLDGRKSVALSLAAVGVGVAGLGLFGWLGSELGPAVAFPASVTPDQALFVILKILGAGAGIAAITLLSFVLHEWCHGLALRGTGARPRYGAKFIARVCPIFYATAPGYWLTKRQYLAFFLAPTVALNMVGFLLLLTPAWWLMVVPLAVHLGGCVGDWWIACVVARFPSGTMFEDTPEGFRFRPAPPPPPPPPPLP